ncbi:helix-turn-helix domain-containing protein [Pontibacter sp. E15-1]|uniref:helix-turn-helix transcriptional regulator n=1 Tax=Pontibacter sp. E15-1 TaxID=2919918 RepID=UPI001F4F8AC5|nr:helix-turn-helix transcriptional regulator [Pontibacter sp. E15-1]MCJ8166311.1 helix-turn-helix domain-containing protein [Pontibacter sp. E15-1]
MEDRIRRVMEYKGLTSTQLADSIEVPRATISHILSGRNKASIDVVIKILSTYRDIASNWLLFAEEPMLINLASTGKLKPPPKPAMQAAPQQGSQPVEPEKDVKKMQEIKPPVSLPALPEKSIEQIMVFYTDKTFSVYKPS